MLHDWLMIVDLDSVAFGSNASELQALLGLLLQLDEQVDAAARTDAGDLVRLSSTTNTKMRDVARDVIELVEAGNRPGVTLVGGRDGVGRSWFVRAGRPPRSSTQCSCDVLAPKFQSRHPRRPCPGDPRPGRRTHALPPGRDRGTTCDAATARWAGRPLSPPRSSASSTLLEHRHSPPPVPSSRLVLDGLPEEELRVAWAGCPTGWLDRV